MRIHYRKAFYHLYAGDKLPRKIKKAILGYRLSSSKLNIKIKQWIKEGDETNTFCPKCGCVGERMVDHRVKYPERWIDCFCSRCGYRVSWTDNSPWYHALDIIKEEYLFNK